MNRVTLALLLGALAAACSKASSQPPAAPSSPGITTITSSPETVTSRESVRDRDARIAAQIRHTFAEHKRRSPEAEAKVLDVSVQGGYVTMRGLVPTEFDRFWIEADIQKIDGVKHVDNELRAMKSKSAETRH